MIEKETDLKESNPAAELLGITEEELRQVTTLLTSDEDPWIRLKKFLESWKEQVNSNQ